MTEYKNAPGITDEQVTAALIAAAETSETLRAEIYADPQRASATRLFAMIQARAEVEAKKLAPEASSEERERLELAFIANTIAEIQGILVEEMSEILAIKK